MTLYERVSAQSGQNRRARLRSAARGPAAPATLRATALIEAKGSIEPASRQRGSKQVKRNARAYRTATGLLLAALSLAAQARGASPEQKVPFAIDAPAMVDALVQFTTQSGIQLMMRVDDAGVIPAKPVVGEYVPVEALRLLLNGSGLQYEWANSRTIAIKTSSDAPEHPRAQGASQRLRLSRAPADVSGERAEEDSQSSQQRDARRADTGTSSAPASQRAAARGGEALEQIIVTGSRLSAPTGAAPLTVFDRARIREIGAGTVADLFKYLPQQPYTRGEEYRFGGAQFAELRGLGADTTLVLINGRRAAISAANGAANAFDLNVIPVSAIERVEVLSDAASAVYGADAVGGVVNIILQHDMHGVTADARWGTASGGAEERRASLALGTGTARVAGNLVLDYFDRASLEGAERERWRDQDYRRFGSSDERSTAANPGNVSSVDGSDLPGLSSSRAAVPHGAAGTLLSPADFLATAGQVNLDSRAARDAIVPQTRRLSALGNLDIDLKPGLAAFFEGMYVDREQNAQFAPSSVSGEVPAAQPFNPFGVAVNVRFLLTGIGPQHERVESQMLRGVAGLKGTLGRWDWEAAYMRGHERARSWDENVADSDRVDAALAALNPAEALNPFQDGPGGSEALLQSLIAAPEISHYTSDASQGSVFLRGPLWDLPAGALELAVGGEARNERLLFDSGIFVDHDRDVRAGFAEMKIPLVAPAMALPGIHLLSATVAAREDHYSDFGDTFNPQVTLAWLPVTSVAVRATYGTSFRPPSLFELYSPRRTLLNNVVLDPRRNGESAVVTVFSGGNRTLEPVTADSWSIGAKWSPESARDVQIGATYWSIHMNDRVRVFSRQLVLANEALFPARVVRAAPTPADVAAGLPGKLLSVDSSRINFGALDTSGVDLTTQWGIETSLGRFTPSIMATWVAKYIAGSAPGTPAVDRIDVANLDGSITAWRGQASVRWQRGPWAATLSGRYIPSYDDADFTGQRTGHRVDAQCLVDAQVSVSLGEGAASAWLKRWTLLAGASNLFDSAPPFSEVGSPLGYDLSQGDLRERFVYVSLSKRF
jgi:iron complex outermembrane receptor protein